MEVIMRSKLSKIVLSVLLVFIYTSCTDLLEKNPKGTVSVDNLKTVDGVDKLLIGAYSLLDGAGSYSGWPSEAYAASVTNWAWNVASDNAYKGSTQGDDAQMGRIERFIHSATNEKMLQNWQVSYDGISRANDVTRAVDGIRGEISEKEANELEAQAKFIRAWWHFRLQRLHYKVPFISEDVENPEEIPNDIQIWDKIEQDLQFGIDHLPNSFEGEPGRADRFAAMAMKGYVHLFQQEWSEASEQFDNIINSGEFELVDSFHHNFTAEHNNNVESIFEIQYSINDGTQWGMNGGADHWNVHPHGTSPLPTCCGFYQPSQDLVNAFKVNDNGLPLLGINGPKFNDSNLENDMGISSTEEFIPTDHPVDPRLDWSVGRRGIPYLDWGVFTGQDWIRDQPHGGPYEMIKTVHSAAGQEEYAESGRQRSNAVNWRAYRLGHVLLWNAEAAVELNNLEKARNLINRVRRRANNDLVMGKVNTYVFDGREIDIDMSEPAANYSVAEYQSFPNQEYAREAVHMEIRLETAMEGRRFFDLVRWGKADEVINEFIENDSEFRSYMRGTSFNPDKHDKFPLPQSQIDLQEGVLVQDPDW